MFESFKEFFAEDPEIAAYKKQQRLHNEFGSFCHEDKRRIFGYVDKEMFGYFNLQYRYFKWREEVYPKTFQDEKLKEFFRMGQAADSLHHAALHHTRSHPSPEETAFMKQTETLWKSARKQYVERMEDEDAACEIFFSHVSEPISREVLDNRFNTTTYPLELTYLFHTKRTQCSSLEQARQFDQAYETLFCSRRSFGLDISYADHPYSLVLDGTLDAPLPLPGVDIPLSTPSSDRAETVEEEPAHAKPADDHAEAAPEEDAEQEAPDDTIYAHAMSVEQAKKEFVFEQDQEFDEQEVYARYRDLSATTDSKAKQASIDTAFEVLKAHLKAQKEAAYQEERALFGFGPTDTITREDLDYRYEKASQETDLKSKQKALDDAYAVLLIIAA